MCIRDRFITFLWWNFSLQFKNPGYSLSICHSSGAVYLSVNEVSCSMVFLNTWCFYWNMQHDFLFLYHMVLLSLAAVWMGCLCCTCTHWIMSITFVFFLCTWFFFPFFFGGGEGGGLHSTLTLNVENVKHTCFKFLSVFGMTYALI